jgi:hypothetical protein
MRAYKENGTPIDESIDMPFKYVILTFQIPQKPAQAPKICTMQELDSYKNNS